MSLIKDKVYAFDETASVLSAFLLPFGVDKETVRKDMLNWFNEINLDFRDDVSYTDVNIPALLALGYKDVKLVDEIINSYIEEQDITNLIEKLARYNNTTFNNIMDVLDRDNLRDLGINMNIKSNFISKIFNSIELLIENPNYIEDLNDSENWLFILPQIYGVNIIVLDENLQFLDEYLSQYHEQIGTIIIQNRGMKYHLIGIGDDDQIKTLFKKDEISFKNL